MEIKLFEVRDAGTFIPVCAIRLQGRTEQEGWLLGRGGYGFPGYDRRYVVLFRLPAEERVNHSPHAWGHNPRTMWLAHEYIEARWDDLESGDVVDVEFYLGLRAEPKRSEREEYG